MKNLASLQSYLESHGCAYEHDACTETIHFGMDGENARWRCMACEQETFTWALVSLMPLRAATPRRAACAELCARINWQLAVGHFDLDFSDGELRYTTLIPVVEKEDPDVIPHLFSAHRVLMDRFVPLFAQVLFAGAEPATALADQPDTGGETILRFSLN